jgi:hypothetical protein
MLWGSQETEGVQRLVRAAKSRENQLRQEGMTGTRAGKAAAKAVASVKPKQQQQQKKKSDAKGCPLNPNSRPEPCLDACRQHHGLLLSIALYPEIMIGLFIYEFSRDAQPCHAGLHLR